MSQENVKYPSTASVLAIIGGSLMVAAALIILVVGTFIVPHISPSEFDITPGIPQSDLPSFVGGVLQGVGFFGLISGAIVLASGAMLRARPDQRTLWGTLILVFSVLSLFGSGGFVVGAILGILGGAWTLTWKPKGQEHLPAPTA
jgi:hypothetical protein